MPVSLGGSGLQVDSPRKLPWQADHYCVRGGPNDPVIQTTPTSPVNSAPGPAGGGSISWNTTFVLPAVSAPFSPTTVNPSPVPRTMALNSGGTFAAGVLGTNTGGLYLLSLPQGAWIQDIELYCYAALAGGSSTAIGLFYTPTPGDLVYPPPSLTLLAGITTPVINTLYGLKSGSGVTAFSVLPTGPALGPGLPITGNAAQLASLGDIDIYIATYLAGGGGVAPTAGCFAAMINFTGDEG
jgi:hypothetical protein